MKNRMVMKKRWMIYLLLFMMVGIIHAQDFSKEAKACFEKGDYACAKRNYLLLHEETGENVSVRIAEADECGKYRISADALFEADIYAKAGEYYRKILDINPKDAHAKKQYNICLEKQRPVEQPAPVVAVITNWEIDMVYVEGGTFTMGCTSEQGNDCDSDERPMHQVTLSSYYIGKYEVTQKQWQDIMGSNPSYFKGDNLPIEQVSWNDVQKFIQKLNQQTGKNYRLPTEAEWEYAARGGSKSRSYKFSGSNAVGEVAWYADNSSSKTQPKGVKRGNKLDTYSTQPIGKKRGNELGIYDMSGNVWEWVNDWSGAYSSSSQTNPVGATSGTGRVCRGGSWYDGAVFVRIPNRSSFAPGGRYYDMGFRLACSLK
jgi:formylglycine-generating enzyme required for sulfatase activity